MNLIGTRNKYGMLRFRKERAAFITKGTNASTSPCPLRRMRVEYRMQAKPGFVFIIERAGVSENHCFMRLRGSENEIFSTYELMG